MMDRASLIGVVFGVSAVVGGNFLEGGRVDSILQPTAALIVFGGTAGATLLSFPFSDVLRAILSLRLVFFGKAADPGALIGEIVRYSQVVRKNGFITIESEIPKIGHEFLKRALGLAVDGMNPKILRETMEQEMMTYEQDGKRIARVFDTAGGFAPTIGIIGAVLGLIHVMENLSDPSKLGTGIAVAFVATVYGVGSANILLLPISKKLTNILNRELALREMILEGVVGIQTGINPHYLEQRMRACIK